MQPLAAACAAAALRDRSVEVAGWDAHYFPEAAPDGSFSLVLLSVQQFEGIERAVRLAYEIGPGTRQPPWSPSGSTRR